MTEISEAAKAKMLEILREQGHEGYSIPFARFIQEVSDAAKRVNDWIDASPPSPRDLMDARATLAPFILPDPAEGFARQLEAEARALADRWCGGSEQRTDAAFCQALIALKRGIELGRQS